MYRRLSIEEREKIAKGLAEKKKIVEISNELGRDRATIYRELNRFKKKEDYSAYYAQMDAKEKERRRKKGKTKLKSQHWEWIEEHLKKKWSPEEISNHIKLNRKAYSFDISHEAIYRYIYSQNEEKKKELITYLRHRKKKRKRRKANLEKRGKIKNAVSIHDRPKEVEKRKTFGHWEGDLVVGKGNKTAIGTLVERKSRYVKIIPLPKGKDSASVVKSFADVFMELPPNLRKSMTYDRGLEMAMHELLSELTGVEVYFADPRSPWQRGTNENTNGLIRDFFPKKTDFSNYTKEDFQRVEDLLNDRPRKVNNFRSPREELAKARGS